MRVRFTILFSILFYTISFGASLKDGVIDLSKPENEGKPLLISGYADLYWREHLNLNEVENTTPSASILLPGVWNGIIIDSAKLPGTGYATISFRITAEEEKRKQLAISIPTIFSSYRLFLDSTELTRCGDAQCRPEATIIDYFPHVVEFELPRDTARMIFQISNFTNDKGGPWQPMFIGEKAVIQRLKERHYSYDLFLSGGLFAFSITYLLSFIIMRQGLSRELSLYFSLFTGMTLIKLLVTSEKILFNLFPEIPTSIFIHFEYFSLFLSLLFYHSYIHNLYKPFSHMRVLIFYRYSLLILTGFSMLTPLIIHSQTIPVVQVLAIILLFYHFYLSFACFKTERAKSLILFFSTIILAFSIIHDIFQNYSKGFSYTLIPLGIVIVSMFQSYIFSKSILQVMQERSKYSKKLAAMNNTLSKFVPQQFFKLLKRTPTSIQLGDQINRKMSVMFVDIRNLEKITDKMNHKEQFTLISTFLDRISPIITSYGGVIDKFIGDSAMAVFPRKPENAVNASLAILSLYYNNSILEGSQQIRPGIGIHYGQMTLGVIGNAERMENTVIGDAVNTAARMKSLTHRFDTDLIVSYEVLKNLFLKNDAFHIRSLGTLAVKGKREHTTIHEIFYVSPHTNSAKLLTNDQFEDAIIFYEKGQYTKAKSLFEECLSVNPNDHAVKVFIEKCEHAVTAAL